jgi:transposase-like protein
LSSKPGSQASHRQGHSFVDVDKRLSISDNGLYTWVSKFKKQTNPKSSDLKAMQSEAAKLKAELRLTTEERDILKKAALSSTGRCKDKHLSPSMSRRGDCWDSAVAESFFSNLKSEQIKKQIYSTKTQAKLEVLDVVGGFYFSEPSKRGALPRACLTDFGLHWVGRENTQTESKTCRLLPEMALSAVRKNPQEPAQTRGSRQKKPTGEPVGFLIWWWGVTTAQTASE